MSQLLDGFGQFLMARVRDQAISDWERILSGQMKGRQAERVRIELGRLSDEDRSVLSRLLPQIVDTTLHHLLWAVEEDQHVRIVVDDGAGGSASVAAESDGLPGELYGERGWVARFSKKGRQDP